MNVGCWLLVAASMVNWIEGWASFRVVSKRRWYFPCCCFVVVFRKGNCTHLSVSQGCCGYQTRNWMGYPGLTLGRTRGMGWQWASPEGHPPRARTETSPEGQNPPWVSSIPDSFLGAKNPLRARSLLPWGPSPMSEDRILPRGTYRIADIVTL